LLRSVTLYVARVGEPLRVLLMVSSDSLTSPAVDRKPHWLSMIGILSKVFRLYLGDHSLTILVDKFSCGSYYNALCVEAAER